jgi:GNAT superfamily N-acetyltransferase
MISPYRKLADPNGTLPEVTFDPKKKTDFAFFTREKIDILYSATLVTKIGECDIITTKERSHFDGVELSPQWRGKGFGLATYLHAIEKAAEDGVPFETQDIYQSEHAVRVWTRLGQLGLAEIIEPFQYYFTHDEHGDLYTGKYRVPLR